MAHKACDIPFLDARLVIISGLLNLYLLPMILYIFPSALGLLLYVFFPSGLASNTNISGIVDFSQRRNNLIVCYYTMHFLTLYCVKLQQKPQGQQSRLS